MGSDPRPVPSEDATKTDKKNQQAHNRNPSRHRHSQNKRGLGDGNHHDRSLNK